MALVGEILGFISQMQQQRQNAEMVGMQNEMMKMKIKETKQRMDLIDKYIVQADTLPENYRIQAKVALGNLLLQGETQEGTIGGEPYKIAGGGTMPGLTQQIASQQTGMQPGGGYIKNALLNELFGMEPESPRWLKGMATPSGPASIMVDPYTGEPMGSMPEYQAPQFQERYNPATQSMERIWVSPPGMGLGQGGGGFITKPGPADQPIPDKDIPLYINPETLESPPVGLTPRQATEKGFKRMTTNARNQIDATKGVISVAANIRQLMSEVFPSQGSALDLGRIERKIGAKLQTNPKATEFDALINGTLAPFIRALGEKGTLADNDIARAKALMPQLTDSADVAWSKLDRLEKLFNEIQQSVVSGSYNTKQGISKGMILKPGTKQEDPLGLRK